MLHGKATGRVVNLHGRNTQVGQNDIGTVNASLRQDFRKACEVAAMGGKDLRTESKHTKTSLGLGQFDGISIQAEQLPSRPKPRQNFLRVAAVAKSAIDRDF